MPREYESKSLLSVSVDNKFSLIIKLRSPPSKKMRKNEKRAYYAEQSIQAIQQFKEDVIA